MNQEYSSPKSTNARQGVWLPIAHQIKSSPRSLIRLRSATILTPTIRKEGVQLTQRALSLAQQSWIRRRIPRFLKGGLRSVTSSHRGIRKTQDTHVVGTMWERRAR